MAKSFGIFDCVIVGDGTAGCVLTDRRSADPDVRVLLLEAGGSETYGVEASWHYLTVSSKSENVS